TEIAANALLAAPLVLDAFDDEPRPRHGLDLLVAQLVGERQVWHRRLRHDLRDELRTLLDRHLERALLAQQRDPAESVAVRKTPGALARAEDAARRQHLELVDAHALRAALEHAGDLVTIAVG